MIFTVALAWMIILHRWYTGTTPSLLVAGALPVSDALGYWSCTNSALGIGTQAPPFIQKAFCFRRAIYPSFLATLLALSNWHMAIVLLLQGVLVALAIFSLCVAAVGMIGIAGSVLVCTLLFSFAAEHVLALLMTEVLGLIAGTVALALLLQGAPAGKSGLLFGGMALLSVGMATRAGALLILPAVLFWIATYVKVRGFQWVTALAGAALALSAGFGLQWLLIVLNGVSPEVSFGSFATVLYRMSIGAASWHVVYSNHPEFTSLPEAEVFRALYRYAFANLLSQPAVFFHTYLKEAQQYMASLLGFEYSAPWDKALMVFFMLGFVRCIRGWRDSRQRLLTLATAAELVLAPLLFGDGQSRVFAVSIGIRAIVTALGFAVFVRSLWAVGSKNKGAPKKTLDREMSIIDSTPWLAIALGCVVVIAPLLPVTPLLNFARLDPLPPPVCATGQEPVVARLDRESLTLGVVNERSEGSVFPVRLPAASLKAGTAGQWFGDEFFRLEPGTLVIQAVNRTAKNFGQIRTLLWRGSMPASGSIVQLCVDPADSIALAEVPYVSVRWISEFKSY